MIHFTCSCGNVLFFENSACLKCGRLVGYDVGTNRMLPVEPKGNHRLCENGVLYGVCNWVMPKTAAGNLCRSCQLTRTLPDLSVRGNLEAWQRLEAEKRRVLYTIARLGLSPLSKTESPDGLAFDFLMPQAGQSVMTGHFEGVITMNIFEADDAYRERERSNLREPYRTLVGHVRHEIGHYYWERFFRGRPENDPRMVELRSLFGDDRMDYQSALDRHYQGGPAANWADQYITAYASVHPWEDWAETWAQYLHILDGLETAHAFGWDGNMVPLPFTPFSAEDLAVQRSAIEASFLKSLNAWAKISPALNEIALSLGQRNLYPFVLNATTARKICFIHQVVATDASQGVVEKSAA